MCNDRIYQSIRTAGKSLNSSLLFNAFYNGAIRIPFWNSPGNGSTRPYDKLWVLRTRLVCYLLNYSATT
jgi:hypothetical protein